MVKTNEMKYEMKEAEEVIGLEEAVCEIMPDNVSADDLKEHMPDLGEVVKILSKDEFFQSILQDLATGKIRGMDELHEILTKELGKE